MYSVTVSDGDIQARPSPCGPVCARPRSHDPHSSSKYTHPGGEVALRHPERSCVSQMERNAADARGDVNVTEVAWRRCDADAARDSIILSPGGVDGRHKSINAAAAPDGPVGVSCFPRPTIVIL